MNTRQPGPTGEYPHGKIDGSDEGALDVGVAYDPKRHVIILNFGKPVLWIAMPPHEARAFSKFLLEQADQADEHLAKELVKDSANATKN
jgi:polysaccharide pyruvyl transferase WcaK-like protein